MEAKEEGEGRGKGGGSGTQKRMYVGRMESVRVYMVWYGMYCKSGFVFPPKQKLTKHGKNEGFSLFLCRLLCLLNHGIKEGYQSLHT